MMRLGQRVYFAQFDFGGPVKIGTAFEVERRIQTVARDFPFSMVELARFPGWLFRERFVQSWLRSSHIRGEWFHPTPEVLHWATEAKTTGDVALVPEEPDFGYAACTATVLKALHGASADDIAKTAARTGRTFEQAFRQPTITSRTILGAVAVHIVRGGGSVPWPSFAATRKQIADAASARRRVADCAASEAA